LHFADVHHSIELTLKLFERGAKLLLFIGHRGLFEPEAVQRLCGDRPPSLAKPESLRVEHAGGQN